MKIPKPGRTPGAGGKGKGPTSRIPKLDDLKKQAASKITAAILVALGVPPQAAQRIAPYVNRVVAVLVAFSLIFSVALFAGRGDGVVGVGEYEEIDSEIRSSAKAVARTYRVPEMLILGLARAQTELGRTSPYDDIDRESPPPGVQAQTFPTVMPGIGDPDIDGQGLGMFLFRADALDGVDPNDWAEAGDLIGQLMREEADRLVDAGLTEPTGEQYAEADQFWARVVDALPLVDPIGGDAGCAVDPSADIPNIVKTVFDCELRRTNNVHYTVVSEGPGGVYILTKVSGRDARDRILNEALGVAWLWGSHNGASDWAALKALSCSDRSTYAGVFPLTAADAKKFGAEDRCDPVQNTTAAVRAYVANMRLSVDVDLARPYLPATAGWGFLSLALGPYSVSQRFATDGPPTYFTASAACTDLVRAWVLNVQSTPQAPLYAAVTVDAPDSAVDSAFNAFNDPVTGAPRVAPACVDTTTGRATTAEKFLGFAALLAEEESHEVSEATKVMGDPTPVLTGIENLSIRKPSQSAPRPARWGVTAAVERLSPDPLTVEYPFFQPVPFQQGIGSLGARAVAFAIAYGGLLPNDPRAGSFPGDEAGFGGVGAGIGVAVERVDPATLPVIPQVSGSKLVKIECGNAGVVRYGLPVLVQRWETMCKDALADGVRLVINSAYRTQAQQQDLYDSNQGSGINSVAKPGSSPHQKGMALDIDLGSSRGLEKNAFKQYAWMHTVVGCYAVKTKQYTPLPAPQLNTTYADSARDGSPACAPPTLPVKRVQTYGLVLLCTHSPLSGAETWASPAALECTWPEKMPESPSGQVREPWHLDVGVIAAQLTAVAFVPAGCDTLPTVDPTDRRSVAIMVKQLWYCKLAAKGFTSIPARNGPGQYTASQWFKNLAEQVASEAVLVAFCESGLNPRSGATKTYRGLFQMGPSELENSGVDPDQWADAIANASAAAEYWVYGFRTGSNLEGWRAWTPVNTQWYSESNPIEVPIVGRFKARAPSPQAGTTSGLPLPNWSINPSRYWGPSGSCVDTANKGVPMPDGDDKPVR